MHGGAGGPTDFDNDLRDQIRRKLHHYMRKHSIGVPTLARRVRDAAPRKQEIPIKTLQRFLAGHMRTTDPYIALFAHFTSELAEPDPIGMLGKAMADLYNSSSDLHLEENYKIIFGFTPDEKVKIKTTNIRIRPDNRFYRVFERSYLPLGTVHFEGVLVFFGNIAVFNMIDVLTRNTKTYHAFKNRKALLGKGIILQNKFHAAKTEDEPAIDAVSFAMDPQS